MVSCSQRAGARQKILKEWCPCIFTPRDKINIYRRAHEIITRNGDHKSWALIDSCVWENSQYICLAGSAQTQARLIVMSLQKKTHEAAATERHKMQKEKCRLLCSLTHLLQISISRLSITYSKQPLGQLNAATTDHQVQTEINYLSKTRNNYCDALNSSVR